MTYEIHGFPAGLARADGAVSAGGREPARATVDLDAIRRNVEVLREHAGSAEVMAVVKADGYGHGLVPSARAALAGGATWLGVAHLSEAITLRDSGAWTPLSRSLEAEGAVRI